MSVNPSIDEKDAVASTGHEHGATSGQTSPSEPESSEYPEAEGDFGERGNDKHRRR